VDDLMHAVLDFSQFDAGEHPTLAAYHTIVAFDGVWTADLVLDLVCRGGRQTAPSVVGLLNDRLSVDVLREVLPHAWSWCDLPQRKLPTREWLTLFKRAGYCTDITAGPMVERPKGPMVIWRGQRTDRPFGMAWSFSRSKAEFFNTRGMAQVLASDNLDAFRRGDRVELGLYEVTVPPHAVLAILTEREEDEVIVNPNCLRGRNTPKLVPMSAPAASLSPFAPGKP
jgi:hypothetical protein